MVLPGFLHVFQDLADSIDQLELEKREVHDDLSDIREAKAFHQMAQKSLGEGDIQRASFELEHAEWCLFFGRQGLDRSVQLLAEIRKTLNPAT